MKVYYLLKQNRFLRVNECDGRKNFGGKSQAIITLWTIETYAVNNRGTVLADTDGCYLRR